MASFDDDSRKRLVSMSRGKDALAKSKEDVTRAAREDREKRALERKREKSAVSIQKNIRGLLARQRERNWFRQDFVQKVADIIKLEQIVGTKQPRFVARASAEKLIRACLFVGDVNSNEMNTGLLTVLARTKPRAQSSSSMEIVGLDDVLSADRYRDAALLAYLVSNPMVSSPDHLQKILDEEHLLSLNSDGLILSSCYPQAFFRACCDSKFYPFTLKVLESLRRGQVDAPHASRMLSSLVQCSEINAQRTGDIIGHLHGAWKNAVFESVSNASAQINIDRPSSLRTKQWCPLYCSMGLRKNMIQEEFSIRKMNRNALISALVYSLPSIETSTTETKTTLGKFSNALMTLGARTLKRPCPALFELCDPKRVAWMLTAARGNTASLSAVCELLNHLLQLGDHPQGGLSARSRVLLGAATGVQSSNNTPAVMFVWEALLGSDSSTTVLLLPFACLGMSVLLDSLDDDELFHRPREYFPLSLMERMINRLKAFLFDSVWLRYNTPQSTGNAASEAAVDLFHQLYSRCVRHPMKVSPNMFLFPAIPPAELGLGTSPASQVKFSQLSTTSRSSPSNNNGDSEEEEEQEGEMALLTAASPRGQSLLRTVPMCVPFEQRVALFHRHLERYKAEHRDDTPRMNEITQQVEFPQRVQVKVRRGSVVEDAFQQIGDKDLSGRLQVSFVNDLGLEEAGIDGGGLFKEFITQFCIEAFGPKCNLFQRNVRTQQLFPVLQFSQLKLLEFVGKILGKAIYENVLVDPEIAPFVLNIVRGTKNGVHDLQFLDEDLYRNLMSLKRMTAQELKELGLTFTVTTRTVHDQVIDIELCRDGRNVLVTKENATMYVESIANFRLNRELLMQMEAFARGFQTLIDPAWVRLFSAHELSMLIGGTAKDFDVNDLKRHVVYGGGYHPSQPYIQEFWDVVAMDLTPHQRGQFLKFITSCSRPPLTGFGSLSPLITVYQVREGDDRLPTASTCVNLLKLPKYPSRHVLRNKLIMAIESESGFELS